MQSVTHLLRAEHVREMSRRREGGVRGVRGRKREDRRGES
jgi:hypothetical protein